MYSVSIIVPVFNEEAFLGRILNFFKNSDQVHQIIVVDGGSTDSSLKIAYSFSNVAVLKSEVKCRSVQMNEAVIRATGDVYYFVHADVVPPASWYSDIQDSMKRNHQIGGYRFKFDSNRPFLKLNSWMTRFNILSFRGGDQTIFISKTLFDDLNGYKEWEIMEEYDLIKRAAKNGFHFHLIQKDVLVSSRKYENNNYFKINFANLIAILKFRVGVDHKKIKTSYFRMINHPKA